MALKTLAQLRNQARSRADMEDDGNFVDDAEANDYVNESVSSLFDILADGDSSQTFAVSAPVLSQIGTNAYALPGDFYKLLSLDLFIGGRYIPAVPADVRQMASLAADPPQKEDLRYILRFDMSTGGRFVYVFPEVDPSALSVVYIPEPTVLVSDTDTFEGMNNWVEFVVVDAALKMLQKQEQETGPLQASRDRLVRRIRDHVRDIDQGTPAKIRDVSHLYDNDFLDYFRRQQ